MLPTTEKTTGERQQKRWLAEIRPHSTPESALWRKDVHDLAGDLNFDAAWGFANVAVQQLGILSEWRLGLSRCDPGRSSAAAMSGIWWRGVESFHHRSELGQTDIAKALWRRLPQPFPRNAD